jgi:hypothetical protein
LTLTNKCEQIEILQDWQKLAGRQETKMMQESEMGLWSGRLEVANQTVKVEHHRNFGKFILMAVAIVAICIFSLQQKAFATEVNVSERWKQLIDLYIKNEFSKGNARLRKFERVGAIPIAIECGSLEQSDCQHAKQVLNGAFEPSANLSLIPSALHLITFVFDNSANVKAMLPIAAKEYASGFFDTSDPQCAIFYKYADSSIQQGKIFAATDQPSNRLYACMVFQIGQLLGPGFSITDRFSDAWDGILSLSSDDKMKQIKHIYGILEYMHMCPELVAGMSEVEARQSLLNPNGCMTKLEGIN